jgi:hypothetical protein
VHVRVIEIRGVEDVAPAFAAFQGRADILGHGIEPSPRLIQGCGDSPLESAP